MNMSPNASSQLNTHKSDPMTDFLSREREAMEAMEDNDAQSHNNISPTISPSLPFPPSPINSVESSVSAHPIVMDAAQLQAVADWKEEFEKVRTHREQQDNEGKRAITEQAEKDMAILKNRHEEEVQGNKERNRNNAQNAQGTWLRSLDGKPLDVKVLEEMAIPNSPAAERILKALLLVHSS